MAYRIPDSNINLSGSYQHGKGNIQISCVPDESLPLLGPNGERMFLLLLRASLCVLCTNARLLLQWSNPLPLYSKPVWEVLRKLLYRTVYDAGCGN